MKKKFLIEKSAFWFVLVLVGGVGPIFLIIILSIYPMQTIADKIGTYGYIGFILVLLPFGLLWKGGYIIFEDTQFVYRESLFSRKKIFQYGEIKKVDFEFARNGTRYGGRNETIFIYLKKRKRSDVHIEIQYEVVKHLIEKKSSRCQVKIKFYSLRIFSEKYRELLKDYLTGAQKKEIAGLLAEKEDEKDKNTKR